MFEKAARYLNPETAVSSPSLVKLGPRTPENRLSVCPNPKTCTAKTCYIVNDSDYSVGYSILLKFGTEFKRMIPEVL